MGDATASDTRTSYDAVADEYVARIASELDHKPFDRAWLDRFADRVRPLGRVADVGCGPGHVAAYLHERGVDVFGVDLSPAMVEAARRRNPRIAFATGDMRAPPIEDEALGGVVAFYSIIHIPRAEVVAVLREMRRTLRPGGWLGLAFHIGEDRVHLDEWWGRRVSVDFHFFGTEEMTAFLEAAGFRMVEAVEREPYPEAEHPSRRAYLLARKPGVATVGEGGDASGASTAGSGRDRGA